MTAALVRRVGERLSEAGNTLAVAESCTGGLLGARLTEQGGASRYFTAGLITYSNEAKMTLLGVPPRDLASHGAVSEPVARAMATGARDRTGATTAVAITGIAGPDGGSPEKPVGTVWIAAVSDAGERVERFLFEGDRTAIREAAVREALTMLERLLTPGR